MGLLGFSARGCVGHRGLLRGWWAAGEVEGVAALGGALFSARGPVLRARAAAARAAGGRRDGAVAACSGSGLGTGYRPASEDLVERDEGMEGVADELAWREGGVVGQGSDLPCGGGGGTQERGVEDLLSEVFGRACDGNVADAAYALGIE